MEKKAKTVDVAISTLRGELAAASPEEKERLLAMLKTFRPLKVRISHLAGHIEITPVGEDEAYSLPIRTWSVPCHQEDRCGED